MRCCENRQNEVFVAMARRSCDAARRRWGRGGDAQMWCICAWEEHHMYPERAVCVGASLSRYASLHNYIYITFMHNLQKGFF